MKTIITTKTIKTCAVVLLILFNLTGTEGLRGNTGSEFHSADSNQIPNVLNMISKQIRSNYERIKSWEGKIEVVTDNIYKGAGAEKVFKTRTDGKGETPRTIINHREQIIEFCVDTDKGLIYTGYYPTKPLEYIDLESGRKLKANSRIVASRRRSIVMPEYQIDCTADTMRDNVVMSHIAVKQARPKDSTCASNTHPVFDPRECFVVGRPIWETFQRLLQHMELHGEVSVDGYALKVEERKNGNDMEYRIQIPGKVSPTDYLFKTMVFSGNKGFNIISLETTDHNGKLFQRRTWNYDLVNGVYVPSKTAKQIFERENGELRYEEQYTYKNLKVNQPIPVETFTYKNLGLENGDKFIDKIENKEYTYQDRKLIEVEKNKAPAKKNK